MQQHRAFRAEAGDDHQIAGQIAFDHAFEHFLRRGTPEHPVEPHRIMLGKARGEVDCVAGAGLGGQGEVRLHGEYPR